jgi:hypothetical protein
MQNNLVSGNTGNSWRFFGSTGGAGGTLTNMTIININTPTVDFESGLNDTGHSVTIWRGDFNPTVTTNGQTTILNNAGFPP